MTCSGLGVQAEVLETVYAVPLGHDLRPIPKPWSVGSRAWGFRVEDYLGRDWVFSARSVVAFSKLLSTRYTTPRYTLNSLVQTTTLKSKPPCPFAGG